MSEMMATSFGRAAAIAALFLFAVLPLIAITALPTIAQKAMRQDTLKIITSTGTHAFDIEIAETDEEKARGLMFRRSLAPNAGMLFPYAPAQEITMWMKNTYISLDMVFIRADGTVLRVAAGTEPFSEKVISSEGDALAVLEVIAGTAAKIGVKAGDKVEHKLFAKPVK
jgi:uncharacterized protein